MKAAAEQLIAWLKESLKPQDRRGDGPVERVYPIRIMTTGNYTGTEVYIGDFRVPHLIDFSLSHEAGKLPVLTLKMSAYRDTDIIGLSTVLADFHVDDAMACIARRKADEQAAASTPSTI